MFYPNYLNEISPLEDFVFAVVIEDDSGIGYSPKIDLDGYQYLRNEECIEKMRQPVACNGHSLLDTEGARKTLIEMAWSVQRFEIKQKGYWSEAAIKKMLEPAAHGHAILMSQTSLDKLVNML